MNIIEQMTKYNLTLRRLPDCMTTSYWLPQNPTEDELLHAQDEIRASGISKEKYERIRSTGCWDNSRYYNGFVIGKLVVKHKACEEGWLVKIDSGYGSTQQWSKKSDFFEKTPEEAIRKAIEHIQARDARLAKLKQDAGL